MALRIPGAPVIVDLGPPAAPVPSLPVVGTFKIPGPDKGQPLFGNGGLIDPLRRIDDREVPLVEVAHRVIVVALLEQIAGPLEAGIVDAAIQIRPTRLRERPRPVIPRLGHHVVTIDHVEVPGRAPVRGLHLRDRRHPTVVVRPGEVDVARDQAGGGPFHVNQGVQVHAVVAVRREDERPKVVVVLHGVQPNGRRAINLRPDLGAQRQQIAPAQPIRLKSRDEQVDGAVGLAPRPGRHVRKVERLDLVEVAPDNG